MFKKILKFLNWSSSAKPQINLNTELYEQLRPFRLPLILVVLMMTIGAMGYVAIDGFSLSDAIYQAGMTFTTVGFTEVAPFYHHVYFTRFCRFYVFYGFDARGFKKRRARSDHKGETNAI